MGRSPHEAFFHPNGRELWVAVRGEDYVSVIDPVRMKEIRRIRTANGPGMVQFRPDGKYAFVPSSFTPEMAVIDTARHRVIARVPQASPFSPNLAVDQDEVWFTLKDSGKTQVVAAVPPFQTIATLESGPITNHVTLVNNERGRFAYVSVGGKDEVHVYRRGMRKPELVATIPTGDLPHGIWGSADGSRVYVGLENADAVQAIDTTANRVIATIPIGQLPQALVYVSQAVSSNDGDKNLAPSRTESATIVLEMAPPDPNGSNAQASVSVDSLGPIDSLQIAATGLQPGKKYKLMLVREGETQELLGLTAGVGGTAIAQTLGPLKRAVAKASTTGETMTLELHSAEQGSTEVVLIQKRP